MKGLSLSWSSDRVDTSIRHYPARAQRPTMPAMGCAHHRLATLHSFVSRLVLPIAVAATLGPAYAYADIYTWVDASGALNVSNLTPPDGARVLKVIHTSEESAASKADTQ